MATLRDAHRGREVPLEADPDWAAGSSERVIDIVEAREKLRTCGVVVRQMSPAHAEVVRLTALGFEQSEINAATGLTAGNVRQIRRRFRIEVERLAA